MSRVDSVHDISNFGDNQSMLGTLPDAGLGEVEHGI